MAIERTFVAIKPDGVMRGLIGEIIRRFERVGLKIVGMKMVWVDEKFAEKHYFEHRGKHFFERLKEYLSSGPVVAMVLEGANAVAIARKIVGPTDGSEAPPGTIRGDFGHMGLKHADERNKLYFNIIHASDSLESAEKEIKLWFKPSELHSYKRADENHVM